MFIQKVVDFFKHDIPYGTKNLIRWFPVIWKDRNWDHIFIYKIFRHKLYLQQKHIRTHDNHLSAKSDADKIMICVHLLDRLINDEYHEMAMKHHDAKWGDGKMEFTEYADDPNLHKLNIVYDNVHTEEDEAKEEKDFKRAMEHEKYLRDQDKNMLFDMMKKYIEGWWD
jgi:hypothetical protein